MNIEHLECLLHSSARYNEIIYNSELYNDAKHLENYLFSEITRFAWDKKVDTNYLAIRDLSNKLAGELI